jgi:hypothetical protein
MGRSFVQDICVCNDRIYCLHADIDRKWSVTTTTVEGVVLWSCDLPNGIYGSIGIEAERVLLHAFHYFTRPKPVNLNCLIEVEPDGNVAIVHSFGNQFGGTVVFLRDSKLLRIQSDSIDIWHLRHSTSSPKIPSNLGKLRSKPNIDLLSKSVAITRKDGTKITVIDKESGMVKEHVIAEPHITAAVAAYEERQTERSGFPVVLPATGSDGEGSLSAIVLPSSRQAFQCVRLSSNGLGSAWVALRIQDYGEAATPAIPIKMLFIGEETGIVKSDGSVVWYRCGAENRTHDSVGVLS